MLIHVIADYGHGDLAFAEVVQRLKLLLPDAEPVLLPVPSFATLAAGFCIGELGLNEAPAGTLIYHNVAPREDDTGAREANAGEHLACARLPTGVRVIGANAGYVYAFIRDAAEELRWAAVPAEGSQFRSRDIFPEAAAAITTGRPDALGDVMQPVDVPDVPPDRVAYVDGYGNIKTTIAHEDAGYPSESRLRVRIGNRAMDAVVSDGSFAVEPGTLAFAPGSSGWPLPEGERVTWIELFLRGGSAWEAFGKPEIGAEIDVKSV